MMYRDKRETHMKVIICDHHPIIKIYIYILTVYIYIYQWFIAGIIVLRWSLTVTSGNISMGHHGRRANHPFIQFSEFPLVIPP